MKYGRIKKVFKTNQRHFTLANYCAEQNKVRGTEKEEKNDNRGEIFCCFGNGCIFIQILSSQYNYYFTYIIGKKDKK